MSDMGALHPQVVHFAIALLFVGVAFRALSLVTRERVAFVGPMALTLLVLGTLAAVVAAYTGDAAHGPIEAMPGLRTAVTAHEEWGERARNIFIVVVLIELVALVLRHPERTRYALFASTIVGALGLGALYETGEHGGEIVYDYAGGVGTRSGDPAAVGNLLRAGLYQQALVERNAGRRQAANDLLEEAARRFPNDIEVSLARAESVLIDRKDAAAAVAQLQAIRPPADNRFVRVRHAMLTADALVATGQREGAIAVLQQIQTEAPSPRVQQRIDEIKRGPAPPTPESVTK
jgi:uncharacterized membrane protein